MNLLIYALVFIQDFNNEHFVIHQNIKSSYYGALGRMNSFFI